MKVVRDEETSNKTVEENTSTPKVYEINAGTLSLKGTRKEIESILMFSQIPFIFSESEGGFIHTSKLQDNHLINSFKKEMEFVSSLEEMAILFNSHKAAELSRRMQAMGAVRK